MCQGNKIKTILEQKSHDFLIDSVIYSQSEQRLISQQAFLKAIEERINKVDASNNNELALMFQDLYKDIYSNAELGWNMLLSDKERLLVSIEMSVFGNSNIHEKVWSKAQKLPIIKVMMNMDEYVRLGRELAEFIQAMEVNKLKFNEGDWWRIKGRKFKVIGHIAYVNFIFIESGKTEDYDAILLSDLLPLEPNDFEYLGEQQ